MRFALGIIAILMLGSCSQPNTDWLDYCLGANVECNQNFHI